MGEGEIDDAAAERLEQALLVELLVEDVDLVVLFLVDRVGKVLGALVHGDYLAVAVTWLPLMVRGVGA